MAIVFENGAGLGEIANLGEDVAGEGFKAAVGGEFDAELVGEIGDIDCAFEFEGGGVAVLLGAGDIVFVFDFAEDLFEDVFEGDDAGGGAVLIDDDGHVGIVGAEDVDQVGQRAGFGDEDGHAHDVAQVELGGAFAEHQDVDQVLQMDDADDLIGAFFEDGEAGELVFVEEDEELFEGRVDGHGDHVAAGDHDLAGGVFFELEEAMDGQLLELLEFAFGLRHGDDEFDFFDGVAAGAFTFPFQTELDGDAFGGALDDGDERAGDAAEDDEDGGDENGEAIGGFDGDVLGDDFADDDMHVGHQGEGEDEGDDGDHLFGERHHQGLHPPHEDLMDGFFAGPTEAKGGNGDADLGDGEESLRVLEEAERGFGAGVTIVGELFQAGFAGAEEGCLGGREEGVRRDDQANEQEPVTVT